MHTIGERITYLRELHNISQRDLSVKLQITPATLSRYENNLYEPKAAILIRLCEILDTSADFLLGLSDLPTRDNKDSRGELSKTALRTINYYCELNDDSKARVEERVLALYEMEKKLH